MKCEICSKEVKNLKALVTHIQFKHSNDQQGYYDKYLKKESEGTCKCCQQSTKFDSIHAGYFIYCSKECMKNDYSEKKKVHNPMHSKTAKQNQRNTNLERYGVSQNTKRPEIKKQIKQTNLERYGCENVSQNKEIKATALKNREATNIKRYGFKCAFSNEKIFEQCQKTGRKRKPFRDTNISYQASYELDFLEKYYDKYPDIQRGPTIKYFYNNEPKNYFPDFYIPSLNLIVEIKNSYHAEIDKEQLKAKETEVRKLGYNFIMFINKDYSKFKEIIFG